MAATINAATPPPIPATRSHGTPFFWAAERFLALLLGTGRSSSSSSRRLRAVVVFLAVRTFALDWGASAMASKTAGSKVAGATVTGSNAGGSGAARFAFDGSASMDALAAGALATGALAADFFFAAGALAGD